MEKSKVHFLCSGERNILESLLGTVEQHISAQGVRYIFIYQASTYFSLLTRQSGCCRT